MTSESTSYFNSAALEVIGTWCATHHDRRAKLPVLRLVVPWKYAPHRHFATVASRSFRHASGYRSVPRPSTWSMYRRRRQSGLIRCEAAHASSRNCRDRA